MILWEAGDKRDPNGKGPMGRTLDFLIRFLGQKQTGVVVKEKITEYNNLYGKNTGSVTSRNAAYATMVDYFYEMVTHFYEWGWGASFHFAYRLQGESFNEAMRRHEYHLASFFGLPPGAKVLDAGCGIGGPGRNLARFMGWNITGVTLNQYQVDRGNELARQQKLADNFRIEQGDFHTLKYADGAFEGAFAIESTCHAPNRDIVFREINRVLKPGGIFATYDWGLTDKFNKANPDHVKIKETIEEGNSLPELININLIAKSMEESGFELVHYRDLALDPNQVVSWHLPVTPTINPFIWPAFQFNPVGLYVMRWALWFMEFLRIVPNGTSKVQAMLQKGALGCAWGGREGIFTPIFLVVGRKPLTSSSAQTASIKSAKV